LLYDVTGVLYRILNLLDKRSKQKFHFNALKMDDDLN
jgi:hypothetical protein